MSWKSRVCIVTVAIVMALVVSLPLQAKEIPVSLTIKGAVSEKAAVVFPHKKHATYFSCLKCHHTTVDSSEMESCFKCHGVDPDAPDPTVSSSGENPFHIRCRGCHKSQDEGPAKCKGCHVA
jgi:hypothetical protein